MLDKLPTELIQLIAAFLLDAADHVALATTCARCHTALLVDSYSVAVAHVKTGYANCVAHRLWRGAELALRHTTLPRASRREVDPALLVPIFHRPEPDSPDWRALVTRLAEMDIVAKSLAMPGNIYTAMPQPRPDYIGPAALAASCGIMPLTRELLPRHDTAQASLVLYILAFAGQTSTVEAMIHELTESLLPEPGNIALQAAAAGGVLHTVYVLLARDDVDPAANDSYAIRMACARGHAEVVAALLADKRADPSSGCNHALRWAACRGYASIVTLLLADPRVNPAACSQFAIR